MEGLPVLQITGNPSVKVGSSGGNSSIYVRTNTDCTVESPVDWISGQINKQGMFSSLVLQIKENTIGKPRSAKVTLKVKGLDPVFVEVTQE
ncbi:hypothetical protein FACS1894181_18990 [Bacteroidia bacterium]|nr:hypothetical protein FACS1894181_18990 [Bacteroidia bacterium]